MPPDFHFFWPVSSSLAIQSTDSWEANKREKNSKHWVITSVSLLIKHSVCHSAIQLVSLQSIIQRVTESIIIIFWHESVSEWVTKWFSHSVIRSWGERWAERLVSVHRIDSVIEALRIVAVWVAQYFICHQFNCSTRPHMSNVWASIQALNWPHQSPSQWPKIIVNWSLIWSHNQSLWGELSGQWVCETDLSVNPSVSPSVHPSASRSIRQPDN